jgi:hypothetical protein
MMNRASEPLHALQAQEAGHRQSSAKSSAPSNNRSLPAPPAAADEFHDDEKRADEQDENAAFAHSLRAHDASEKPTPVALERYAARRVVARVRPPTVSAQARG